MNEILLSVLIAVIAYMLGSFSTGTAIASSQGVEIRKHGSKSTGASNVLRVLGLKSGVITFIGDFGKAALACWIGSLILPEETFGVEGFGKMLGGLFAVLGHNWPVYYHFKGGKGVACSAAVIFFINPLLGIISIGVCVGVIALTRYISLGSMTMLMMFMVLVCATHWGEWTFCGFTILLFIMCVWRHRANIHRLRTGTENKIGRHVTSAEEKNQ